MKLLGSVGRKGKNLSNDTELVQIALNRTIKLPYQLLAVDKLIGSKTIRTIERFQQQILKMSQPDGRIDVNGKTWQALSQYLVDPPKERITPTSYMSAPFKTTQQKSKDTKPFSMVNITTPIKIAWGAKVSSEFKFKVISICRDLRINPDFLMACMAFETAETFSPSKKNMAGSSGTGLIQFMKATAEGLDTSIEELSKMTAVQQLDYVKQYFKVQRKSYRTLEDVYLAILRPASVGKLTDHVLFSDGSKEYIQNKGLDLDKDGKITVKEVSTKVRLAYEKGLKTGYLG